MKKLLALFVLALATVASGQALFNAPGYLAQYTFATAQPPTISGATSNVLSSTNAAAIWTTSENTTNNTVDYGISTSYTNSVTVNTSGTSQSNFLGGLVASTVYHFRCRSTAVSSGLSATNADQTFTTQDTPVTYVVNEGFEAGSHPTGWYPNGGSWVNYGYTPALIGSYSAKCDGALGQGAGGTTAFSTGWWQEQGAGSILTNDAVYYKFAIKFDKLAAGQYWTFMVFTESGAAVEVIIYYTGYIGLAGDTFSAHPLAEGTMYYFWLRFKKDTFQTVRWYTSDDYDNAWEASPSHDLPALNFVYPYLGIYGNYTTNSAIVDGVKCAITPFK